jgi:hypothetical protein
MNTNTKIFFLFCLIFPASVILAQDNFSEQLQSFHQQRKDIIESAMLVLGGWAAGNILAGTYGNFRSSVRQNIFISLMLCGMWLT